MSLRFEQALDVAREAQGRAKIMVTISVNRGNGVVNCFTGTLCYSNKKQGEFISEETLSTTSDQPLQHCSSFAATIPQSTVLLQLQNDAIDFSISNNLVENRIGMFKSAHAESSMHVIKFEERGSFLIAVERQGKSNDSEILYTIAFTDVIADPISSSSTHF